MLGAINTDTFCKGCERRLIYRQQTLATPHLTIALLIPNWTCSSQPSEMHLWCHQEAELSKAYRVLPKTSGVAGTLQPFPSGYQPPTHLCAIPSSVWQQEINKTVSASFHNSVSSCLLYQESAGLNYEELSRQPCFIPVPNEKPVLTGQMVFSGAFLHQAGWERHPLRKNIYAQLQCLIKKYQTVISPVLLYDLQELHKSLQEK